MTDSRGRRRPLGIPRNRRVGMALPEHLSLDAELKATYQQLAAIGDSLDAAGYTWPASAARRTARALRGLVKRLQRALPRDLPSMISPEDREAAAACYRLPDEAVRVKAGRQGPRLAMTAAAHMTFSETLLELHRKVYALANLMGDTHLAGEVDAAIQLEMWLRLLIVRMDDQMFLDFPWPRSPEAEDAIARCYLGRLADP